MLSPRVSKLAVAALGAVGVFAGALALGLAPNDEVPRSAIIALVASATGVILFLGLSAYGDRWIDGHDAMRAGPRVRGGDRPDLQELLTREVAKAELQRAQQEFEHLVVNEVGHDRESMLRGAGEALLARAERAVDLGVLTDAEVEILAREITSLWMRSGLPIGRLSHARIGMY